MSKSIFIANNQDDPLSLKFKRFYQKARIIALITLFFALPLRVIAEDYQLADEHNDSFFSSDNKKGGDLLVSIQGNALMELNNPETVKRKKGTVLSQKSVSQELYFKKWVLVTAYSSTVDQCDSTPFITASGTHVHDGTIAANFLRFGTKVKFPALFGNKIFTVEDRMKSNSKVDIWFPTRENALQFGAKRTMIEILTR